LCYGGNKKDMYKVITDEKDIKAYQDIFVEIFQVDTAKYKDRKIGFPGGSEKCDIQWSSNFKFWSANNKLTEGGNRYRNWFGFTNPKNNDNLSVDVEISISICGSKTAGKFVRDENTIFITHNGDIRKNRRSIRDIFLTHCKNSRNWKIINVDGDELIIIAELPSEKTKYIDSQSKVSAFIRDAYRIKNNANEKIDDNDKHQSKSIQKGVIPVPKKALKETKKYKPNPDNVKSDKILKLVSNIRRLINKINENRDKKREHPIFIDKYLSPLWTDIEEPCISEDKNGFIVFILNLYKLIFETTRVKAKKFKNEGKYYYDFLLPDKFLEKGTETREFIDIVGSLRHGYAHKAPEYKVTIRKMSYPDILEKLLEDSNKKEEDYSVMQIELLKRFENAMKKLLEIVKNES